MVVAAALIVRAVMIRCNPGLPRRSMPGPGRIPPHTGVPALCRR